MKKFFGFMLVSILTFVACGKVADPMTLPQTDEVISMDITVGENTVQHSDKTWIGEILTDLSGAEPTKKESVQDIPQVEGLIKIDFHLKTGISTLFAYEDHGKYYIEQPYRGIYSIDRRLFERLQEAMPPGSLRAPSSVFYLSPPTQTDCLRRRVSDHHA